MNRRELMSAAVAMGATALWSSRTAAASRLAWREARAAYPQGVASGDPDEHSVILWTRRPFEARTESALTVEVSRDPDFRSVVATARAPVLAASGWTCRVLAGGLDPASVYWYRFTDETGQGSRVGRTITAPKPSDPRTVRFAFVSCQSVNEGKQNAYRRMIWEDEKAPAGRVSQRVKKGLPAYQGRFGREQSAIENRIDVRLLDVARHEVIVADAVADAMRSQEYDDSVSSARLLQLFQHRKYVGARRRGATVAQRVYMHGSKLLRAAGQRSREFLRITRRVGQIQIVSECREYVRTYREHVEIATIRGLRRRSMSGRQQLL